MKFGCCASLIALEPDGTGVEVVEKLNEIGYDFIELSLSHITALSDCDFEVLKNRVDLSGIKCEACNDFFPAVLKLTGRDVQIEKTMLYVEKALYRASQLGIEFAGFGSGPSRTVPESFSMDMAWQQLVNLLRNIDTVAKKYGITVLIEAVRKQECNIINTTKEALALVNEVDRDNIKLIIDFYHLSVEKENPDIMLKAKEHLKHIHIASVEGRLFPSELEEFNYSALIDNLKKIHYKGRISIEAYSKDFYADAVNSLKLLKRNFS